MKGWTGPEAILERLQREWDRGRILSHLLGGSSLFPYRVPLAGPTTREVVGRYTAVREWIKELSAWQTAEMTLEWRDYKHPQLGQNRIPTAAIIQTPEAALQYLKKVEDARRVAKALRLIGERVPALSEWAMSRPLRVLEFSEVWSPLLTVVEWVLAHPRSGLYLRQVDAPEVDTKFIEHHRHILMELLDQVLNPALIDERFTGVLGFEARYGFRQKPQPVRFRPLDPGHSIYGMTDITVSSEEFSRLQLSIRRVFMMENEIDFLAFPSVPESMAVFGAGYGLKRFQSAAWLSDVPVYYWGDIDTHGLAILDELRLYLPHAESLLMDQETLFAHRVFWDHENTPATKTLSRLTTQETDLYQGLQGDRWGQGVRLEQERIPLHWLRDRLIQMGLDGERTW